MIVLSTVKKKKYKGIMMSSDNNLKAKTVPIKSGTTTLLIAALLCAMSCKECPTEPDYSISMSTDFIGASMVRLQISIPDSGDVRDFGIKRDGILIIEGQLASKDTLITDATAEPATSYQYQGMVYRNGDVSDYSEKIDVTTLDTTSHDIEWTTYRYGYLGSYLRDVCIISEDDIWAVGAIETEETAHNDAIDRYNAVHWNGSEWKLERIPSNTVYGTIGTFPLTSIYAFNSNDVWTFSGFGAYSHWDGEQWKTEYITERSGGVEKIWGNSSSSIYFIGSLGNITHFNNGSWIEINNYSTRHLTDISGISDDLIYMVGSDQDDWSSNFIIYEDGVVNNLDFPDTCMQAVYATAWNDVYLVGEGMLYYDGRKINDWSWPSGLPKNLLQAVRGNGPNDIFLAGHMGTVIHYNGKTWQYYQDLFDANALYAISVKNDCIVAVGLGDQQGIIYHGRR